MQKAASVVPDAAFSLLKVGGSVCGKKVQPAEDLRGWSWCVALRVHGLRRQRRFFRRCAEVEGHTRSAAQQNAWRAGAAAVLQRLKAVSLTCHRVFFSCSWERVATAAGTTIIATKISPTKRSCMLMLLAAMVLPPMCIIMLTNHAVHSTRGINRMAQKL